MAKRAKRPKSTKPTRDLQKMGGKEERVSQVGRAREQTEQREEQGQARFDVVPGPDTEDLLRGPKGPPTARTGRTVSRRQRAEPGQPEPEDRKTSRPPGAPPDSDEASD